MHHSVHNNDIHCAIHNNYIHSACISLHSDTKMPRGKKRRISHALDALIAEERVHDEQFDSCHRAPDTESRTELAEKCPQKTKCGGHDSSDVHTPLDQPLDDLSAMACDYPSKPNIIQKDGPLLSEWGLALLGQTLNLVPVTFLSLRMQYVRNIINHCLGEDFTMEEIVLIAEKANQVFSVNMDYLQKPDSSLLWSVSMVTGTPHNEFLGPPTSICLKCQGGLSLHNSPSTVILFGVNGPKPALKITLRCENCMINYRYYYIASMHVWLIS